MRNRLGVLLMLAAGLLISGCVSNSGHLNQGFVSETKKQDSGAKTVMQCVPVEATCTYVLGIPIGGDGPELWSHAMGKLRAEAKLDGKARAFANMTTDHTTWGFSPIYWVEKITLTADVVEFQ